MGIKLKIQKTSTYTIRTCRCIITLSNRIKKPFQLQRPSLVSPNTLWSSANRCNSKKIPIFQIIAKIHNIFDFFASIYSSYRIIERQRARHISVRAKQILYLAYLLYYNWNRFKTCLIENTSQAWSLITFCFIFNKSCFYPSWPSNCISASILCPNCSK